MLITVSRFKPDRLLHSLLSQGGAQVFKLLVSVGIGGWTARYLGPQNLGTLSYVAALVGLLGPLGNLGVKGSLRVMLCEERPLPGLLGSAVLIELIGTFLIAVVLIPFAWWARDPLVVGLIGLAILGNLLSSSEVFEVELLNRQRGTQLARVETVQTIAGAVLSVMALVAQAPLLVFGGLPVLQAAIKSWLLAGAVQVKSLFQLLKQASWKTCLALIQRGWPFILSGLSVMLYMKSDQVMIEWFQGPKEVGLYSVASKVAESLYFIPVILTNTFFPRLGRSIGQFETNSPLRQLYRSAWILGVGMSLTTIFVLPPLIPFVFGDEYAPAQLALIFLGPASFGVSIGCASGAWLNTQGLQKFMAQRTALGALLNITLNLALIPRFSLYGAAVATLVSYTLAPVLSMLFHSKATRRNVFQLLVPL